MKTILVSSLTAALLGVAASISLRALGAAEFSALFFATGLVAWTIEQYSRTTRPLPLSRPLRFPAVLPRAESVPAEIRHAA